MLIHERFLVHRDNGFRGRRAVAPKPKKKGSRNGSTLFHKNLYAHLSGHGVEGLRAANASIIPNLIGGNANAPTIMISKIAATMIMKDQKSRAHVTS